MRITRISVYQVDLPLRDSGMACSSVPSPRLLDSTVVKIETDEGTDGFGEACPYGHSYLPAYPQGTRAGIELLAPLLIGQNPMQIERVNQFMDKTLPGHPDAKSALDMACWDILGKFTSLPLVELMGGSTGVPLKIYDGIGVNKNTPDSIEETMKNLRDEGCTSYSLKVGGGSPEEDISRIRAAANSLRPEEALTVDANQGWIPAQALRVIRTVNDLDVYIEQPCKTYDECLIVRRLINHPMILDESIDNIADIARAYKDGFNAVKLKLSHIGGLSKAKKARDLCITLGILVGIEDTGGSDITAAACYHLAQSTSSDSLLGGGVYNFNSYITVHTAKDLPKVIDKTVNAPNDPGLGIEPLRETLGNPLVQYT